MVPSGIDEQGVDHGGLLLRLSHLPAADATQRRLELVGEGEVVAPQLKAPAPPRRRVGAAEAVGEGGPPVSTSSIDNTKGQDRTCIYREFNIGEDERELRPPSSKAHPRSFPYPRAPNLGPQREPRGQYCYVLGFGASSPPASDGPPPSASPWSPTAPPWRAAAPSVRAPMGGRALPLSRAVPLSPLQ